MTVPKSLIINSPYQEPTRHWQQGSGTALSLIEGRRPAAYEVFDTRTPNNTKRTEELKLVNRIRGRVREWREADYPGITQVTRSLLLVRPQAVDRDVPAQRPRSPAFPDIRDCRTVPPRRRKRRGRHENTAAPRL